MAGNRPPQNLLWIQAHPYTYNTGKFFIDVYRYWLGQYHTCNSPESERRQVR